MKKIFTLLLVIMPIISVYKSPIPGMDLATFLSCVVLAISLLNKENLKISLKNKRIKISIIVLCIYIIFSTLLACLLQNQINYANVFFRTFKFVFLLIGMLVYGYDNLFDGNLGIRLLRNVTIYSSIYIILQTLAFYLFKTVLPGTIISLIEEQELYFYMTYEYASQLDLYRPTSFFLEPSMFAEYVILYLCYALLKSNRTKKDIIDAIIISIGIIASTSGQGYLFCFIIWAAYIYKEFLKNCDLQRKIILLIILIISISIIPAVLNISIISKTLKRGTTQNQEGNPFMVRTEAIKDFKDLDIILKIIGVGYGNPIKNEFMSSGNYTLYCTGILGAICVINVYYNILKNNSKMYYKNIFIIVWMISIIFTTTFIATYICFYISFLLIETENSIKKIDNEREKRKNENTLDS